MQSLADIYQSIEQAPNPRSAAVEHSFKGLAEHEIKDIRANASLDFYRGKVRDLIIHPGHLEIIHSDRLTAFDRFIDLVPYKGVILNKLSAYWLEKAKEVIATHLVEAKDDRTLLVKKTDPIRVEVVVRGYLAGSMARAYGRGERQFCGVRLPEGLSPYKKLPHPIITPTTKAPVGDHDEAISAAEVVERGICSQSEWQTICEAALKIFKLGTDVIAEKGWILVDTKYEFGKDESGKIILIDEIHTPDSSRFWVAETYTTSSQPQMLDKEIVRKWLLEQGFDGHGEPPEVPVPKLLELANVYLQVCEKFTGQTLYISN